MTEIKEITTEMTKEQLRECLEKELPVIIARKKISHYTGGLYSTATLACADSQGKGPKDAWQSEGREVFYPKQSLIDWLLDRWSNLKQKNKKYGINMAQSMEIDKEREG